MISKNIPAPTVTQFELWANKFEDNIKIYLINDFRECGIDSNKPIDFDTFKNWIYKDHNLYLNYANKSISIATSLICLDEIGFTDNSQIISYPSFSK